MGGLIGEIGWPGVARRGQAQTPSVHPQTGRLAGQFAYLAAQNNTNFVPGGSKKPEKPSTLTPKNQKIGQIDPSNFQKWLRQA
jgi:hypothetical protein